MFDIVTVYHADHNAEQAASLRVRLERFETEIPFEFIEVDNRVINRGFSRACNMGAAQGTNDYIGFLNPDAIVSGSVLPHVKGVFDNYPGIVVTGERFGKPPHELKIWGCQDWVCGAAFFVRRDWFEKLDGFDEEYTWGWEETDFIRRTQQAGLNVKSISLPIHHDSPTVNSPEDLEYKNEHFEKGAKRFREKWNGVSR